jgi:hypothetical protein
MDTGPDYAPSGPRHKHQFGPQPTSYMIVMRCIMKSSALIHFKDGKQINSDIDGEIKEDYFIQSTERNYFE